MTTLTLTPTAHTGSVCHPPRNRLPVADNGRDEPDDAELIARAQQAQSEAVDALARRLRPVTFRLAYQMVGNREDAGDLTQETLLRFFTSLPSFDARRPLLPWLRRILRNRAVDMHRRATVRRADSLDTDSWDGTALEVPSPCEDPERATQRQELRERMTACLARLDPRHREILVLREYQDLSYQEIADSLGIPIGTVMSRLHTARNKLRALL